MADSLMPSSSMRIGLVVAATLLAPRLAAASGGFLPPLEVAVGRASIETPQGDAVMATQVMVGVSWASLYPKPTPVDFSVGWIGAFVPDPDAPGVAARELVDGVHDANGAFLGFGVRAAAGSHWRAWIGGRGELLSTDDTGILGGFGRVSAELWMPAVLHGHGGGVVGTLAVTAWAEVGVRERSDRSLANVVAAGIGVRIPLIAAY